MMNATTFNSGDGETTKIGYINRNDQKCCGHRGVAGSDHLQLAYRMECLKCGHVYGANGSDIHLRKCPQCQDDKKGIEY